MGEIDFAKRMRIVPDEELFSVVSSPDGYVPAAVEAAQAEIARRNLGSGDVARIVADVEERQRFEENKSSIPLSTAGKIAFFVFSIFLFWTIIAAIVLGYRGYGRKSTDGFKWMCIGLAFWLTASWALFLIIG